MYKLGNLFDPGDVQQHVGGINQVVWEPSTLTLYAQSDEHLSQDTSYLLIVTRGIHDVAGDPIELSESFKDLRRFHSNDAQSKLYALGLAILLNEEVLERVSDDLSPRDVAAASLFTTGSVTADMEKIRDKIHRSPAPQESFTLGSHGERTVFPLSSIQGILFGQQTTTAGPLNTVPVPTPALGIFPGSVSATAFGKFSAMNFENANAVSLRFRHARANRKSKAPKTSSSISSFPPERDRRTDGRLPSSVMVLVTTRTTAR